MNKSVFTVVLNAIILLISVMSVSVQAAPRCQPLAFASRTLPAATDGKPYKESIQVFGGALPVSVMLTSGVLPPGVKLTPTGELAGTPTAPGNYQITVTAIDSCKPMEQSVPAFLSIFVNKKGADSKGPESSVVRKAPLKLTTEAIPRKVTITAGPDFRATIRYKLTALPAETATMDSPSASFVVNGSVAESILSPLTAVILNGTGEVEETVKISKKVLDFAARENASKIVYSRAFIGRRTTTIGVVDFEISR